LAVRSLLVAKAVVEDDVSDQHASVGRCSGHQLSTKSIFYAELTASADLSIGALVLGYLVAHWRLHRHPRAKRMAR
jgi:hypothetical protein